jgi:hypothetical protein
MTERPTPERWSPAGASAKRRRLVREWALAQHVVAQRPSVPMTFHREPMPARRLAAHADTSAAVDAFMHTLVHPCHAEIGWLRTLMLGLDDSIAEGVKWNAPSFRTTGYFATTNLRAKAGFGVILHLGAKVRPADGGATIDDPENLLHWHSHDRASVQFGSAEEFRAGAAAFSAIVRQWIRFI